MKLLLYCGSFLFMGFLAFSCTKKQTFNNELVDNSGLDNKWNIVYDSNYVGVGLGNHVEVYHGQSGDYFNFAGGGTLYMHENGQDDTSSYRFFSNSTMAIVGFGAWYNGVPDTCLVTNQSASSVTITTSLFFPTPAGIFGRKVILSR